MTFEYKTIGAPEKGQRKRGLRSQSDRVAYAFEQVLQAEATRSKQGRDARDAFEGRGA